MEKVLYAEHLSIVVKVYSYGKNRNLTQVHQLGVTYSADKKIIEREQAYQHYQTENRTGNYIKYDFFSG
jgi:hypothetical protein